MRIPLLQGSERERRGRNKESLLVRAHVGLHMTHVTWATCLPVLRLCSSPNLFASTENPRSGYGRFFRKLDVALPYLARACADKACPQRNSLLQGRETRLLSNSVT